MVEVMFSVLFVCVCQSISVKLGIMIVSINRKNWLTRGGNPVTDADSGSLFHFPHQRRIDYSNQLLFTKLGEMSEADKGMSPLHFVSYPADTRIL